MWNPPNADSCPFNLDGDWRETLTISTDSGVLVLADPSDGVPEWEDLLLHGDMHRHVDGGFAVAGQSVGVHVPYDGSFTVTTIGGEGFVRVVAVDLQHIVDTFHDVDEMSGAFPHHGPGDHVDGWSEPGVVDLSSEQSWFGDPAALLDDGPDGMLTVGWPADGRVWFTSHTHDGFRDTLMFCWSDSEN